MLKPAQVGLLFVALSLLFFGLSLRDYLKAGPKTTPARRTWLRVAIIFGAVGGYLYFSNAR